MRRRPLRLAVVLLLALGVSIALASGCATTESGDTGSPSCPYVSCLSEDGRNQCISAGCSCASSSGLCQAPEKGPAAPRPVCPLVDCNSSVGHAQCVAAGCTCNPKTNGCMPVPQS